MSLHTAKLCSTISDQLVSYIIDLLNLLDHIIITGYCIKDIILHTQTSGVNYAASDSPHKLVLTIGGYARSVTIPCNVDNKYCGKGAIVEFYFNIKEFYSGIIPSCVDPQDITAAVLKQGGNDGLLLKSVYTTYTTTCGRELPMSADKVFNKWVDGNGSPSQLEQDLTLV